MIGLPAPDEVKQIEMENGTTLLKADGTPLRRVPLIRAHKDIDISSDEDEPDDETQGSTALTKTTLFRPLPVGQLAKIKAEAAARRAANPSPMAIATEEAKARVSAAREMRDKQLEKIEEWDQAMDQLNRQRDEMVMEVMEKQKMLGSENSPGNDAMIKAAVVAFEGNGREENEGRIVEVDDLVEVGVAY